MIICGQAGCLLNSGFASILCMLLKRSFRLILLFPIWPYRKVLFFCFGQKETNTTLHFPHSCHGSGVPWPCHVGLQRLSLTADAAACTTAPCSVSASWGRLGRRVGCGLCGLSWQESCRLGSPPWLWGAKYTGVCLFHGLCVVCLFSYHVAKLQVQAGNLRSCIRNYVCGVC